MLPRMKTRFLTATLLIGVGFAGMVAAQGPSTDWPQWRGPNRDGSAPSFKAPSAWPETLTQRWKIDIGLGYATPVVSGNRVYTFSRQGDDEIVSALDAADGKAVWTTKYAAPYNLIQAAARHGKGPKGTPVLADGRLFTLGISGILSAFDASTGKQLWQKSAPAVGPQFSTSQSPVYDHGLLIAHLGGQGQGALTAFDPATGEARWRWDGDGPGYGSPVVAEIAGTRQVIALTWQNLVGVSAETGALLWKRTFRSRSDVNALTPLVIGDTVVVSGGDAGILAVRVAKQDAQWTITDAWKSDEAYFQFSNLVQVGDVLFGLSAQNSGRYVIIDVKTGKLLWGGPGRAAENAAFQKSGNLLLVLEASGDLVVADGANKEAFTPLKRYKVADAATWAAPAISGNRIFVKDVSTLALWTVG
jgi:outer membrane protein assembly factor BamB